ncbi:MAG: helix-turn-helix transcriptional regulator, partial [Oscillospiraceae bacterium]|nr:helix-turn-helix transcriptional regulator [Oscillospiraceae bacterium]
DISLGVIGDQVGLSPKYFSRYFKEQTGVPFSQYVNRFRVDRAKRLLAEPQSQVKLVAQQVGFENVNTFIRVFKSFEGISPGIYKETLLKKESDADPR